MFPFNSAQRLPTTGKEDIKQLKQTQIVNAISIIHKQMWNGYGIHSSGSNFSQTMNVE